MGPRSERQASSAAEGEEKAVGLGSPAALGAGLCRRRLFPFIRGETDSPSALTSPPSHATTPGAFGRPQRAAGSDWRQRKGK